MPDAQIPNYSQPVFTFLPWVRQGIVDAAARQATIEGGRLALSFRLDVTGQTTRSVDAPIRLFGPGDVTGIDPREIVRVEPTHLGADFEAAYFPAIEFDRPDFPWLFTPAAPQDNKLTPWLCLVVVERRGDVMLTPAEPLPRLTCRRDDLPDLAEAWKWAHAQVAWTPQKNAAGQPIVSEAAVAQVIDEQPERSISRILSTQPLVADRGYYACLVPTYLVGVKAGLGEPITGADESTLAPAWTAVTSATTAPDRSQPVTLPVYYHWEFATGRAVTFESLVRRLRARPLDPAVGKTALDIRNPGWGIAPRDPATSEGTVRLEGALRVSTAKVTASATSATSPTIALPSLAGGVRLPVSGPIVAAAKPDVPVWIRQELERILMPKPPAGGDLLVLPPVYGAIHAGVASLPAEGQTRAWLRELNLDPRYRVAAGLGTLVVRYEQERLMAAAWDQAASQRDQERRAASGELAKQVHVGITAKLQGLQGARLAQVVEPMSDMGGAPAPASASAASSALSPAFRRLTRAHGPIARRMRGDGQAVLDGAALVTKLTLDAKVQPVTMSAMSMRSAEVSAGTIAPAPDAPVTPAVGERLVSATVRAISATPVYRMATERLKLIDALLGASQEATGAPLAPTPTTEPTPLPSFDAPMYETLRDYFSELFLPGMDRVEPNSVALLETNPRFIESFMVGLNHEMSRELLWREFATDLRSTFFRRFWDSPVPNAPPDIPPIRGWTGALGSAVSASPDGQLVLLIRGDLLRRFPGATIYALKGVLAGTTPALPADGSADATPILPIFRGSKAPDITFFGFSLSPAAAKGASGSAGYFFVIQEQPTEARFGWDAHNRTGAGSIGGAALARRTLQRPFRVAIHAKAILP